MRIKFYRKDPVLQTFIPTGEFDSSENLNLTETLNSKKVLVLTIPSTTYRLIGEVTPHATVAYVPELNYAGFVIGKASDSFMGFKTITFGDPLSVLEGTNQDGRFLQAPLQFLDQYIEDIAWQLINLTQTDTGGWLGIYRGLYTLSDQLGIKSYLNYDNIGNLIQNFTDNESPFDFEFKVVTSNDEFAGWLFNLYSPRKVSTRSDLPYLAIQRNIETTSVRADRIPINRIVAIGGGANNLITTTANDTASQLSLGLHQRIVNYGGITSYELLQSKANFELTQNVSPYIYDINIKLIPSTYNYLDIELGDYLIYAQGNDDLIPNDTQVRVLRKSLSISSNSTTFTIDVTTK